MRWYSDFSAGGDLERWLFRVISYCRPPRFPRLFMGRRHVRDALCAAAREVHAVRHVGVPLGPTEPCWSDSFAPGPEWPLSGVLLDSADAPPAPGCAHRPCRREQLALLLELAEEGLLREHVFDVAAMSVSEEELRGVRVPPSGPDPLNLSGLVRRVAAHLSAMTDAQLSGADAPRLCLKLVMEVCEADAGRDAARDALTAGSQSPAGPSSPARVGDKEDWVAAALAVQARLARAQADMGHLVAAVNDMPELGEDARVALLGLLRAAGAPSGDGLAAASRGVKRGRDLA